MLGDGFRLCEAKGDSRKVREREEEREREDERERGDADDAGAYSVYDPERVRDLRERTRCGGRVTATVMTEETTIRLGCLRTWSFVLFSFVSSGVAPNMRSARMGGGLETRDLPPLAPDPAGLAPLAFPGGGRWWLPEALRGGTGGFPLRLFLPPLRAP